MLIDSGLPNTYWGETAMTANYSENVIHTKSITRNPFEVSNGNKPNIHHITVLGSIVYVLDRITRKITTWSSWLLEC